MKNRDNNDFHLSKSLFPVTIGIPSVSAWSDHEERILQAFHESLKELRLIPLPHPVASVTDSPTAQIPQRITKATTLGANSATAEAITSIRGSTVVQKQKKQKQANQKQANQNQNQLPNDIRHSDDVHAIHNTDTGSGNTYYQNQDVGNHNSAVEFHPIFEDLNPGDNQGQSLQSQVSPPKDVCFNHQYQNININHPNPPYQLDPQAYSQDKTNSPKHNQDQEATTRPFDDNCNPSSTSLAPQTPVAQHILLNHTPNEGAPSSSQSYLNDHSSQSYLNDHIFSSHWSYMNQHTAVKGAQNGSSFSNQTALIYHLLFFCNPLYLTVIHSIFQGKLISLSGHKRELLIQAENEIVAKLESLQAVMGFDPIKRIPLLDAFLRRFYCFQELLNDSFRRQHQFEIILNEQEKKQRQQQQRLQLQKNVKRNSSGVGLKMQDESEVKAEADGEGNTRTSDMGQSLTRKRKSLSLSKELEQKFEAAWKSKSRISLKEKKNMIAETGVSMTLIVKWITSRNRMKKKLHLQHDNYGDDTNGNKLEYEHGNDYDDNSYEIDDANKNATENENEKENITPSNG